MFVVSREQRRMGEKSCVWIVGLWLGIRREKDWRKAREGRKGS
jgi:hypothetical protein